MTSPETILPGGLGNQTNDRKIGDRLSGARLADDAQRLAALQLKRDAIDGLDRAVFSVEVGAQVPDFEKISVAWCVISILDTVMLQS